MPAYEDDEELIFPDADFESILREPHKKQSPKNSGWAELTLGKTIGKRVNIAVPSSLVLTRSASLNLFEIGNGSDRNALPLSVTLAQPKLIPATKLPGGVIPADNTIINNATGERANQEFLGDSFAVDGEITWIPAVALIEWGIGGVQNQAEVDWVNGMTANLSASFIRVSAFIDNVNNGIFNFNAGIVSLQAFVGPGNVNRGIAAQRTISVGLVNNGPPNAATRAGFPSVGFGPNEATYHPSLFPVPPMAKQVTLEAITSNLGGTFSNVDWSAQILFYRTTLNSVFAAARFTNNQREPVPVPNGAQFFTVQNDGNDAAHIIFDCNAVFDLAI